ncbi:MAG: flippase-like domain-containing protein, partial [Planctomycetes bacterium]|nr:flippase-like domain-containing protein [Planctomycetota bacterium]
GCPTGFFEAFRLTYIGFFFNIVVPGLTGGDVVKAVMVARRHPERKAAAAISVLVDRLIGVLVLALLGALTILAQGERFAAVRTPLLVGLGFAVLGVLGYTNATLRRVVGFERWIDKLPMAGMFRQIDEAATIYSRRPLEFALALLFSLFNQACVIGALSMLGASFGERALGLVNYVVVASIGNIAAAVPLTPGGVGVTEVVYGQLFEMQGGTLLFGIAISLAWRVCMISVGLLGGLFLLLPTGRGAVESALPRSNQTPDVG